MRILALSGSLRRASHNRALIRAAAAELPSGVTLEEWDGLGSLPAFNEDLEEVGVPEPVLAFRQAVAEADAVLISTPEYNASMPGVLKNALDWASRPYATNVFRGKPVAVVGASTGLFGAVWAQAETRKVLKYLGAEVSDAELPVGMCETAFGEDGCLADDDQQTRLAGIVRGLVASNPDSNVSLAA